jgi:hypothetical protein
MNGETSLLLDTNIVIGFLNGNAAIAHFFSRTKTQQIPRFERGLLLNDWLRFSFTRSKLRSSPVVRRELD